MRLERMLGHIPALLHPHPRSVLIVGVGAGVTAGALSIHPEVERIVICEIEPMVPRERARSSSAKRTTTSSTIRACELVFDDARHFLQTTDEKFDIITSDPIHPWVRGAATLYSLEYLQLGKRSPQPRRRGHAVDPALRDRRAIGEERDRHLRAGVSRYDAVESRSARGRLRPGRARARRAGADQRGGDPGAARRRAARQEIARRGVAEIGGALFSAPTRAAAATWRRGWRMRRSIASGTCDCSIWRDWPRTPTSGS